MDIYLSGYHTSEFLQKFNEIYNNHGKFNKLNYLEKIKFYSDNELGTSGNYYYKIYKTNKDKTPKVFSILPKVLKTSKDQYGNEYEVHDENENREFNKYLLHNHFNLRLEEIKKELEDTIHKSTNPTQYIKQQIDLRETKYNEFDKRNKFSPYREINQLNAYWFGYQSELTKNESIINVDYYRFMTYILPFCSGMIDANIIPFLNKQLIIESQKFNSNEIIKSDINNTFTPIQPLKDITTLKQLMNTTNENEFIGVINSIYDLVKFNKDDKRADKKKVRYSTHLLIKNGWLIDKTTNKEVYLTTILEYFGYKPNKGDFERFNFPDVVDLATSINNKLYNSIYSKVKENKDRTHK